MNISVEHDQPVIESDQTLKSSLPENSTEANSNQPPLIFVSIILLLKAALMFFASTRSAA